MVVTEEFIEAIEAITETPEALPLEHFDARFLLVRIIIVFYTSMLQRRSLQRTFIGF